MNKLVKNNSCNKKSKVGNILTDINKNSKEFKREMNIANRFMILKKVNRHLQLRIRNYLEY